MKKNQKNIKKGDIQISIFEIFEDHFLKKEKEREREKQVLIDKFDLHIKGKEILLENSK